MNLNSLRRLDVAFRRGLTLADYSFLLAKIWGDRIMVAEPERSRLLSFVDAERLVAGWAQTLSEEIDPGDRVVLATPNGYDQFLLCLAVSRAGGLPVPVNAQMQPAEVRHVVKDSGAVKVIDHAEDLALGEPMEPTSLPDPGQIAALFYTSGTTGSPKGVELTHKALVGQNSTAVLWPAHMRRDEVLLALPVAHIMGFISVVGLSLAGVQTVFFERFRANRVMDAIEHRRCSGFVGVPAMYRMMVEAGAAERDLSSVRIWMSGADVMPADLARQFKRFGASATVPLVGPIGEATFVEGYGMVEVGGGIAAKVSPPMVPLGVGDTVGFKLPGYHFKVVDTDGDEVMLGGLGELLVRGPGVLKGYWNAPDATDAALTPDGWLRTGDLVRVGPFGTVLFRGRTKQVIKSGGYSVYPLEVEATLETHPEVVEASVVGMEDPKLGEVPIAAVRLVPSSTCTGEEIGRWAAEELAHYKVPRRVVILDDFPRTGTQKVQKDRLKEIMSAR